MLRIDFYQSTIEGCARPGSQSLEVRGIDIVATLTLMQPPPTSWAIPCDDEVVELDAVEPIGAPLEPGETYRVIVNDVVTTTFSLPRPGLGHSFIAESPIQSAEVEILESSPPQYQLRIVSGLPKGSGCSQANGYELRRRESNEIEVIVSHHEVADGQVVCTADFPIVETTIPLGSEFEPGEKYTVRVNSDKTTSFVAQVAFGQDLLQKGLGCPDSNCVSMATPPFSHVFTLFITRKLGAAEEALRVHALCLLSAGNAH